MPWSPRMSTIVSTRGAAMGPRGPRPWRVPHWAALSCVLGVLACDGGAAKQAISGGDDEVPTLPEDPADWPTSAPDGYFVVGNTIYTSEGIPHIFRGVDRPSLEWNSEGQYLSADDYQRMASWNANVVRIALNQGFWLEDSAFYDATYRDRIDENIDWAHAAGLDVILDLHWSDRGSPTVRPDQQIMADQRSLVFWESAANRYKDDGRVMFELYNEPHDIPWDVWLNGGSWGAAGQTFNVAGMQELYDAVRETGAENLVLVGGLDYAYMLASVPDYRVEGYNIAYVSHPYDFPNKQSDTWDYAFGDLSRTDPIVLTEFGQFSCGGDYSQALIEYAEARGISWTAWAWWAGDCDFPSLITDWDGTPSEAGVVVRDALMRYN